MVTLQDIQKMNLKTAPVAGSSPLTSVPNQMGVNAKAPVTPAPKTNTLPTNQVGGNLSSKVPFKAPPINVPSNFNVKGLTTPNPVTINKGVISGTGFPSGGTYGTPTPAKITAPTAVAPVSPQKAPGTTPPANTTTTTPQYYDTQTRALTAEGRAAGKPDLNAPTTTPTYTPAPTYTPTTTTTTTPTTDTSRSGILTDLIKKGNETPEQINTINKKLIDLKDKEAAITMEYNKQMANTGSEAVPGAIQQGRQRILTDQYKADIAAISGEMNSVADQLSAANQTFGIQAGATTSALGAVAPQLQFGMLTETAPGSTGGQIVGGQGAVASGVINNAVSQAYNFYRNGATLDDAIKYSKLDTIGPVGIQALNTLIASGGQGFNPSAYNTQTETNMSNLSANQTESFKVGQNLQQVKAIEPVLLNMLKDNGVNPFDAQMYNGPVNDYLQNIGNSAAANSWALAMADLKNYTSQLMASGYGGTPTGAEAMTLSGDPSKLSYQGLQYYLRTLEGLGGNRKAILDQMRQGLGATGAGYTGGKTNLTTSVGSSPMAKGEVGTGITNPTAQAAAGFASNTLPSLASNTVQGAVMGGGASLGMKLLKFIGIK